MRDQFLLYLLFSENITRDSVDIENIEPATAADHHNDWVANIEEISHSDGTDEPQARTLPPGNTGIAWP